jgi:hypothetical protein
MAAVRGTWTIDEGIAARWSAKSLDDRFREWWPTDATSADDSHYPVLHDTEARPTPPGPYCVYEHGAGATEQRHSGLTTSTNNEIHRIPLQFRIHAKTQNLSGKFIAKELAKYVVAAFDFNAGYLDIEPDKHVNTFRQADFPIQEGDQEWSWNLQYDLIVDVAYDNLIAT